MDLIINSLAWVAGALAIFMMLGVSADVVGRYFFSKPILGMDEANEVLILWIVFLGAAWLVKKDAHVNMDIVMLMLKPRARAVVDMISSIICAAASLVIFWYSVIVILNLFHRGTLETGNLTINTGYVLLAIPIGCLPMAIQFLRKAYGLSKQLAAPAAGTAQPTGLAAGEPEGK